MNTTFPVVSVNDFIKNLLISSLIIEAHCQLGPVLSQWKNSGTESSIAIINRQDVIAHI